MRLLLIRHGETVHNVAGVYAGITDSALTNHGVLQANRLGTYLASSGIKVSHIYSSDLQRAFKTAEAIRLAQDQSSAVTPRDVTKLELLREQDFGSYEGKRFRERVRHSNQGGKDSQPERADSGFKDIESKESMIARTNKFVNDHLLRLFDTVQEDHSVVVVAHGVILLHLWRGVLSRFMPVSVSVASGIMATDELFNPYYPRSWSNTGYLDFEIKPRSIGGSPRISTAHLSTTSKPSVYHLSSPGQASPEPIEPTASETTLAGSSTVSQLGAATPEEVVTSETPGPQFLSMSLVVKAVNSLQHLNGLKKTRGGIGSSKHDSSQKTMDSFFSKKRKYG